MPVYLLEPASEPAASPDYGSSITGIRSELSSIDTDTTAIAASIATVASNLTTLASNSTFIKSSLQTIENSVNTGSTTLVSVLTDTKEVLEEMEAHQQKLRELGEGDGIHIISPYEYFSLITIYKRLIEEGKILDEPTIQKSATKEAKQRAETYLNAFKDLPKMF